MTDQTDIPITKPGARVRPQMGQQKVISLQLQSAGGEVRQTFRLHKPRIVIGSVVSADVRITEPDVSPIHAVLELEGAPENPSGQATIYDLASDSGVFVGGKKIVSHRLGPGDRIRIGSHELSYSVDELSDILARGGSRTRETGLEGRKLFLDPNEDLGALLLVDDADIQPIFDYRPSEKRALEVVMAWKGTILDVQHFVDAPGSGDVTIGSSRENDFGIPPILSSPRFALVTRRGDDFLLNLDPRMGGVMQRSGTLQSIEEIRAQGSRAGPENLAAIPFLPSDFAKVSVGEVDFYLSTTVAPPRLRRGRLIERDPFFLKIFGISMTLTALCILALWDADVPQPLDAEKVPDRIATILYQPEKYPAMTHEREESVEKPAQVKNPATPKPVPPKTQEPPKQVVKVEVHPHDVRKPVPHEMQVTQGKTPSKHLTEQKKRAGETVARSQNEAKEGEGARAKGEEGMRGSKKAAPGREHQNLAARPSPQGGSGRGSGDSQIRNEGNVDILKDATGKIQDILGDSAAHLGPGGEKLKGFGGFTTQGQGGLALSGKGAGGGGDAESLGGLGEKGHGGGRVGTGLGASGSGSGIIGGQTRVAIRSGGPEEAVVMGSIDADAVEAAMMAHRDEFRHCYEEEINAENHARLAGRVGTTFVIGPSGRVTKAAIESSSMNDATVEACILKIIRRIDFPIPRGAGVVQVSFPFKFNPGGK